MATHQTNLEISGSVPAELEVGANLTLKVRIWCPEGCDLRGIPAKVVAGDEILITSELVAYDEKINETGDFSLKAPGTVGEHAWSILFPRHETADVVHEESSFLVSFTTRRHSTSMAVWDVPSPVVMNRPFNVKVGVKCSAACPLMGHLIEVCDEAGVHIGESTLGETPWPGTSALYVAEVELAAPATEGMSSWSARYVAKDPGLPHAEESASFSFRTARPAEYPRPSRERRCEIGRVWSIDRRTRAGKPGTPRRHIRARC